MLNDVFFNNFVFFFLSRDFQLITFFLHSLSFYLFFSYFWVTVFLLSLHLDGSLQLLFVENDTKLCFFVYNIFSFMRQLIYGKLINKEIIIVKILDKKRVSIKMIHTYSPFTNSI